ncbi:MAG: pilin [bacterium]|nr:pilin [bacterium]
MMNFLPHLSRILRGLAAMAKEYRINPFRIVPILWKGAGFIYAAIILKVLSIGTALAQGGNLSPDGGRLQPDGGNLGGGQTTLLNPLGVETFPALVQRILSWLFTLSIPIVSIMVMVGGYYILTAAGNEERLKTGRNTILYAVIGFAVILIANGVVSLIRQLTGV